MTVLAAPEAIGAGEAAAGGAAASGATKAKPKKHAQSSSRKSAPSKKKSSGGALSSFLTGGSRYSEKHYRRILAAEFVLGLVILTWEELTNQAPMQVTINGVKHTPPRLKQYAAWCFAFFLLSLLTTGGTRMARIASQLGGLTLLAIMLKPVSDGKGGTTFAGSNMFDAVTRLFGGAKPQGKSNITIAPDAPSGPVITLSPSSFSTTGLERVT